MGIFDRFRKAKALPAAEKRCDDNFNGLIGNGYSQLQSGGGWANYTTGLGTFSRDKVMQASFADPIRITDPELSALYHGNDLAARIVEMKPREMFRRGYQLVIPDPENREQNPNAELAEDAEKYAAGIRANEMILDGKIFGRLFGGALLLIGADDGQDPSEPLNEDAIRSVRFLNLIDRRFLFAQKYYSDPWHPKYGEVETYQVTNAFGSEVNSIVHESRVLRFDGAHVEILKKRQLAGWTLSVVQRPYDVLRQFDSSFQAAANLLVDASQGVFKMKGLIDMISSGDAQTLQTRMALVDMSRSAARSVLLDAETEDFNRIATSFSGVPDILDRFMQRLASAADMPVTILFGRSPAGLSATGEADFQHFYDSIATQQTTELMPLLLRLYKLIFLAQDGPTGGELPEEGIEIKFHPLRQPSEKEQAELENSIGTRDVAYVNAGILLPEEVALSRFRGGTFRLSTEIDVEARTKSLEASLDFSVQSAEAKAEQGPQEQMPLTPQEPSNTVVPPVLP